MLHKLVRLAISGGVIAIAMLATGANISAASPNLFATVSASGALVNGNGVSSVAHTSATGKYEVTFNTNVSACAYVATTQNAFSQALQVFTAGGHLSVNGVYVEVKNQGGGLTDGPFDLAVACGSAGWQFAVVGYTANLVRASGGITLSHTGVGSYNVTSMAALNRCAFLATVGDPANALVAAPAGVYTASGASTNIVSVETKNPGGGLTDGIPFHLAVVCPNALSTDLLVVFINGVPIRGSGLTSSFNASTGNYIIVTNRSLALCTVIGTRGSVDTAVPFTPATVEVRPGPAFNTAGIQVRKLLFFGGALVNQAFHAAAIC